MEAIFFLFPLVFIGVFVLVVVSAVRRSGYLERRRTGPGWNADLVARSVRRGQGISDPLDCAALLTPVKTEPGQQLAVRLRPGDASPALAGGCLLGMAIFWCSITGIVGGAFFVSFLNGEQSGWLMLFFVPFVLIGLGLLFAALRQIVLGVRVPLAVVELEREPLCPGDAVRLRVAQAGGFSLNSYTVDLECIEHVSYTQGTDTRHEERVVLTERVLEAGAREVSAMRPLDEQLTLRIPIGAPVSFHAAHNDLIWRISVAGDIQFWPNPKWHFPFRVVPPNVRGRT